MGVRKAEGRTPQVVGTASAKAWRVQQPAEGERDIWCRLGRDVRGGQAPSHPSRDLECQAAGLQREAWKAFVQQGVAGLDEKEPSLTSF